MGFYSIVYILSAGFYCNIDMSQLGFIVFHCCFRDFDAAAGLSCICFPQIESNSDSSNGSSTAVELCCFELHLLYRPGHYDILYI